MFNTFQCYTYKCLGCQTFHKKMDINQPEDMKDCEKCQVKEPIRFVLDGAPSGFVKGGTSNKAGITSGKVFNG